MIKKTTGKMKDVFNNVEYLTIKRNNRQLLLLEDKDINGMSRTALAKMIGNKIGEGVFHYTVKYFDNPKITVGKISSIISKAEQGKEAIPDFSHITDQMKRLEEKFESGPNNQNFKDVMEMKDAAYKIQIEFWKSQCDMLKMENDKLKKELESDGGGSSSLVETLLPALLQALNK